MSLRSVLSGSSPASVPCGGAPRAVPEPPSPEPPSPEPPAQAAPLTPAGVEAALARLSLEPAALWAVMRVEAKACGFLADRRPVILFERHVFHRRTGGVFASSHPEVSNPKPGGYGRPGAHQHDRLAAAQALDRVAALESASWGLGQVMGFNAGVAGYPDVVAFVAAMRAGEDAQLGAMAAFIAANGLDRALRRRDWTGFARGYNGPGFARNAYDVKLATAFADYASGARPPPDLRLRALQMRLLFLGFAPGPVDGVFGRRTRTALAAFRVGSGADPAAARDPPTEADEIALADAAGRLGARAAARA
ncbi:N-acetylmuramidase domain-containing protein [Salinarimonas sp.]|uniref:N-acetylmuramidase domain-containing protein n=1 Tax=Salinarimonas sp. TaxID=2766526 RepID=UPI0032D975F4